RLTCSSLVRGRRQSSPPCRSSPRCWPPMVWSCCPSTKALPLRPGRRRALPRSTKRSVRHPSWPCAWLAVGGQPTDLGDDARTVVPVAEAEECLRTHREGILPRELPFGIVH